jgi:hypothetical protein
MNRLRGLGGQMQFQICTSMIETSQENDTQLKAIRELMLTHSLRNNWLTLGEIAEVTEFGEASISAQLRHLRMPRYGRFRVDKRRRQLQRLNGSNESEAMNCATGIWEYRVLPPY